MSEKPPNFVKVITFWAVFAIRYLVASLPTQKNLKFAEKNWNFLGGQNELALMTLSRNSKKLTKFRQSEHMFVNFRLQASSPVRSYPKKANFCRKLQFFMGGWKELTLMTLSRNIGKITKVRQSQHIFGNFCLQASTCIHTYPQKVKFCRNLQIFEGDQKELTSMTRPQIVGKRSKIHPSEHIFGNFSFQESSCIHSYPKIINFCRKIQNFV